MFDIDIMTETEAFMVIEALYAAASKNFDVKAMYYWIKFDEENIQNSFYPVMP